MEEEACCDPCEREQLKYRVTAEMLREKFRIKAQQCLDIAAEWSKKDDNLCSHGYVVEHEQMAEQFTRRAEMLADGDYLLTGDLLDAIFQDIKEPVDDTAKQEITAFRGPSSGMRRPINY